MGLFLRSSYFKISVPCACIDARYDWLKVAKVDVYHIKRISITFGFCASKGQ